MRDYVVTFILVALTVVSAGRPDVGVLSWTWVSMMNPHRLTWDFAYELPAALMIASATMIGLVVSKRRLRFISSPPVLFLLLFDLWMVATHFLGYHPTLVEDKALSILKIQFMVFVTMFVLCTKSHIILFVGVVTASLAFFGVKGGIFTILHGGDFRVWGPPNSALEGNNEIALALVMTIPLIYFFMTISTGKWVKRSLLMVAILCAAAALGSQSRGALLAIVAMTAFLWLRSKSKVLAGAVLLAAGIVLVGIMSVTWSDRMQTITNYEEDLSAMQRLDVWRLAWNIAVANPVLGGGMGIYTDDLNAIFNPNAIGGLRNAHSIYFAVLGEHGFVGLTLFLLIWISVWTSCRRVRRLSVHSEQLGWAFWLASMLQVSLVGYLVGGAFLYLAYADFPYNLLIASVVLRDWVEREANGKVAEASQTRESYRGVRQRARALGR